MNIDYFPRASQCLEKSRLLKGLAEEVEYWQKWAFMCPMGMTILIVSPLPLFPLVTPFSELTEPHSKLGLFGTFSIRTLASECTPWDCSVVLNTGALQSLCFSPQLTD